jgi:hypothetical protein
MDQVQSTCSYQTQAATSHLPVASSQDSAKAPLNFLSQSSFRLTKNIPIPIPPFPKISVTLDELVLQFIEWLKPETPVDICVLGPSAAGAIGGAINSRYHLVVKMASPVAGND